MSMKPSSSSLKRIGSALFAIGSLLALALTALLVWADVEAVQYGFPRMGKGPMRGLSCPQFMNGTEDTGFSLTLTNTLDRVLRPGVQVFISDPGISRWRTFTQRFDMEPGESQTETWDVSAGDIVLGTFVFAKVHTYASYPQSDMEGVCGIFVVGIPWLRGAVLFWLWFVLSLGFLITGFWLSDIRKVEGEPSSENAFVRRILALLAVTGLIAGSIGLWLVGIIVLAVTALALLTAFAIRQSI